MLALLEAEQFDVVTITETFLSDEISDGELFDGGYSIFRRERDRHGGGVLIFIKHDLPAVRQHDLETDCELIWIELKDATSKILLGTFYRPPSSNSEYLAQLQTSLAKIPCSQPVVLCGDFNVPIIDWSIPSPLVCTQSASVLCDLVQEFSQQQLVPEPTRKANTLDLIFCNTPDMVCGIKIADNLQGTDHQAVDFSLSLTIPAQTLVRRWVYSFKHADFDKFRNLLSVIPWKSCLLGENIEEDWQCFKDLLFSAANQCIPRVMIKNKKRKSWLSDETLT